MKYIITIQTVAPYNVKEEKIEAADGKQYNSAYLVPKEVAYKRVSYETGEVAHTTETVYTQEVEGLEIKDVIKAINKI